MSNVWVYIIEWDQNESSFTFVGGSLSIARLFLQKSSILDLLMHASGLNLSNRMTVNRSIRAPSPASIGERGYRPGTVMSV